MTRCLSLTTLLAIVTLAFPTLAAPHLGMKLACKHYGDAWNSGSRSALMGQITGDFAHQFRRMPDDMFRTMPRGGAGKVLSHSKSGSSGRVTVSTSHGVITFVVVGSGFNWRVADIYKPGDDGNTVSLKGYLDASLTAHEFIRDLTKRQDKQFYNAISGDFRGAFTKLNDEEIQLVRQMIPGVKLVSKPYLSISGSRATMHVRLEGDRKARLDLVRQGSWKVDDYSVESPSSKIASFKRSLDTIVAVQRFRKFMVEPKSLHPDLFVAKGPLHDSLSRVHKLGFLPMHQKPSPMRHIEINTTGEEVTIDLTDRHVRIKLDRSEQKAVVAKAEVTMGQRWADLGHLIALNERVRSSIGIIGLARPQLPVAAAITEEASVLTNASAEEIETATAEPVPAPKPISDQAVKPAVAATSAPPVVASSAPLVRQVSYSTRYVESGRKFHRGQIIRINKRFRNR